MWKIFRILYFVSHNCLQTTLNTFPENTFPSCHMTTNSVQCGNCKFVVTTNVFIIATMFSICKDNNNIWRPLTSTPFRSSCPEVFYKKGVLKKLIKFTGKHLWHRLFSNKVVGLRPGIVGLVIVTGKIRAFLIWTAFKNYVLYNQNYCFVDTCGND